MSHAEEMYTLMLTEYPDLLSADQTAEILGASKKHVYTMITDGYLFGVKIGKAYKVSKIRLIEYLIGDTAA